MIKIRINNIECRKYKSTKTKEIHYEIIKWYENKYFNKRDKMLSKDFKETFSGDGTTNGSYTIDNSCFKNKESCYTIASLYLNYREPDIYLKSVGSRLLDLSKEERLDLFEVYKIANNKITKIHFK